MAASRANPRAGPLRERRQVIAGRKSVLREAWAAHRQRFVVRLIKTAARPTHTITADNGTEFHGYGAIEAETGSKFYFAAPYHSWERGTSENTNGLIRQYLPKRTSMAHITQHACNRIAHKLNNRPRKRLGFLTPKDCYELNSTT